MVRRDAFSICPIKQLPSLLDMWIPNGLHMFLLKFVSGLQTINLEILSVILSNVFCHVNSFRWVYWKRVKKKKKRTHREHSISESDLYWATLKLAWAVVSDCAWGILASKQYVAQKRVFRPKPIKVWWQRVTEVLIEIFSIRIRLKALHFSFRFWVAMLKGPLHTRQFAFLEHRGKRVWCSHIERWKFVRLRAGRHNCPAEVWAQKLKEGCWVLWQACIKSLFLHVCTSYRDLSPAENSVVSSLRGSHYCVPSMQTQDKHQSCESCLLIHSQHYFQGDLNLGQPKNQMTRAQTQQKVLPNQNQQEI